MVSECAMCMGTVNVVSKYCGTKVNGTRHEAGKLSKQKKLLNCVTEGHLALRSVHEMQTGACVHKPRGHGAELNVQHYLFHHISSENAGSICIDKATARGRTEGQGGYGDLAGGPERKDRSALGGLMFPMLNGSSLRRFLPFFRSSFLRPPNRLGHLTQLHPFLFIFPMPPLSNTRCEDFPQGQWVSVRCQCFLCVRGVRSDIFLSVSNTPLPQTLLSIHDALQIVPADLVCFSAHRGSVL